MVYCLIDPLTFAWWFIWKVENASEEKSDVGNLVILGENGRDAWNQPPKSLEKMHWSIIKRLTEEIQKFKNFDGEIPYFLK